MIRTLISLTIGLALVAAPFARVALDAKPIAGGANQNDSVEGCTGQTLFDGIWRLRVDDVQSAHRPFSGVPERRATRLKCNFVTVRTELFR